MDVDEEDVKGALKNKLDGKSSRRGLDGSKRSGAKFRGKISKGDRRRS